MEVEPMASYETIYWALPGEMPRRSRQRLASLARQTFPVSASPEECVRWCLSHVHAHDAAICELRALHSLGVELSVRNIGTATEELAIRDPRKVLSQEKRAQLAEDPDDLITLLRFGPVTELTPSEFARSASVARFQTTHGPVILAADNADPCHPALRGLEEGAIYRVRDLPNLPEVQALWQSRTRFPAFSAVPPAAPYGGGK